MYVFPMLEFFVPGHSEFVSGHYEFRATKFDSKALLLKYQLLGFY